MKVSLFIVMSVCAAIEIPKEIEDIKLNGVITKLNNLKLEFYKFLLTLDEKIKKDPQSIFIFILSNKYLITETESVLKLIKEILAETFDKETVKKCEKITSKIIINVPKITNKNREVLLIVIVSNMEIIYNIIQKLYITYNNNVNSFEIKYCDEIVKYYDCKKEIILNNTFEALKRIEKLKILLDLLEK